MMLDSSSFGHMRQYAFSNRSGMAVAAVADCGSAAKWALTLLDRNVNNLTLLKDAQVH